MRPSGPSARVGQIVALAIVVLLAHACARGEQQQQTSDSATGTVSRERDPSCAPDNGGLTLPDGFCASIFADTIGRARHVAVAPNGDVFVALEWQAAPEGQGATKATRVLAAAVALRDTNRDGKADTLAWIGSGVRGGTGIAVVDSFVYVDQRSRIVRYPIRPDSFGAFGTGETVVSNIPATEGHIARNFHVDRNGNLFVNVGSATNSCQRKDREAMSPGLDPCRELETRAGIWRFDARKTGQTFSRQARYATGIRNAMGIAAGPDGRLYATQHGRDQLHDNWPRQFDTKYNAENPAEELFQVNEGDDFGWPYCYYSVAEKKHVLAPEYGGDGRKVERCAQTKAPVAVYPGHWAPMSLLFYTGSTFPEKYRGGVFIAFHGSWNRAPEPQAGYRVVFQPIANGAASGDYETFADGFAQGELQPDRAAHRPVGLAQGADGSLFITDDARGRVWRVVHR